MKLRKGSSEYPLDKKSLLTVNADRRDEEHAQISVNKLEDCLVLSTFFKETTDRFLISVGVIIRAKLTLGVVWDMQVGLSLASSLVLQHNRQ